MLQNIKLHLHPDADVQSANEKRAIEDMLQRKNENFTFFQHVMPNIVAQLGDDNNATYSIVCNSNQELNIVDSSTGAVVYGLQPENEIEEQVSQFFKLARFVSLSGGEQPSTTFFPEVLEGLDSPLAEALRENAPFERKRAVVVVLGVGLGYHIRSLIERGDIAHLIVYEPNLDFFSCALLANKWQETFRLAREHNTAVYLQLGENGSSLQSDIAELANNVDIDGFYLYQHYHAPTFDAITSTLARTNWQDFELSVPAPSKKIDDYVPIWSPPLDVADWKQCNLDKKLFRKNLDVFKNYFPDIYESFKDYTPDKWVPLANSDGEVNVLHRETLASLHTQTPRSDGATLFSHYAEHPNQHNIVIPPTRSKYQRYHHFRFASEAEATLKMIENSEGRLPEEIETLIVFEMGVGYALEPLQSRQIDLLFICEPNRDYFYASLYAFDWDKLLRTIDARNGRAYLNIGDDGSNLASDLVSKFSALGVHVLSNAYFYRGSYNLWLNPALDELNEQLRLIIAMQGYFDHSLSTLTHTKKNVEQHASFLMQEADRALSREHKEVPVFIVGNGPSLDALFPTLRENADRAIIISCGTALQSLHKNGITPDFHAEVEMNRSTCDWVGRIGDPEYLKKIRLVSWSAVHPDLSDMFHSSLLVFKRGEPPTVAVDKMYSGFPLVSLKYAYPTVSNLAANFVCQFGFEECYLFGTDLGFVDDKYHHSKSSGYYLDQGKELYDLSKRNNTTLQVEGNFRPFVFTKSEFKFSCNVLGSLFSTTPGSVYNLNDGAKIRGTSPLRPEHVLISSTPEQKSTALSWLVNGCFINFIPKDFNLRFENQYSSHQLTEEFQGLKDCVQVIDEAPDSPDKIIKAHRQLLERANNRKGSLFLLLLKGSVELMNCVLNRIRIVEDTKMRSAALARILTAWREFLEQADSTLKLDFNALDFVSSFVLQRKAVRYRLLLDQSSVENIEVVPSSAKAYLNEILPAELKANADITTKAGNPGLKIAFYDAGNSRLEERVSCYIVTHIEDLRTIRNTLTTPIVYCPGNFEERRVSVVCNPVMALRCALEAAVNGYQDAIVLPKLILDPEQQSVEDHYDLTMVNDCFVYDCNTYLLLTKYQIADGQRVNNMGDRLRYLPKVIQKDFVYEEQDLTQQQVEKDRLRVAIIGSQNG